MHEFLSFNGKISDASEIRLPAVSAATFYGRGIFTTVAIYGSRPFQWESHWRRLTENAKTVGVDLSGFTEAKVKDSLSEIIHRNGVEKGRARLTFFKESTSGIWRIESKRRTSCLITSADFRDVPNDLRLTVSPYQINSKSPLAGVKSCNYLENILALEEAESRGFAEAVRLNEKYEIASATMANVFWALGGDIFTPPTAAAGALAGTTRDFVLKNFPVREKQAALDELTAADEVFLTSAGVGVARVGSFEKRNFETADVFLKVRSFFDEKTGARPPENHCEFLT